MANIRGLHDPITNKTYDYMTTSMREDHLYTVLEAVLNNECPPDNAYYLCEKPEADEVDELIQCAKCYQIWAGKVGGADSPRARKLSEAIDLAAYDKCPTEDKDKLCNVSEDEGTDEETCARCILRWATIPFAKFK